MNEARREALRVDFDHSIKLEFHGTKVSSDGGLVKQMFDQLLIRSG